MVPILASHDRIGRRGAKPRKNKKKQNPPPGIAINISSSLLIRTRVQKEQHKRKRETGKRKKEHSREEEREKRRAGESGRPYADKLRYWEGTHHDADGHIQLAVFGAEPPPHSAYKVSNMPKKRGCQP